MRRIKLTDKLILERIALSAGWLLRSIQATGNSGSAGYYQMFKGWSPAYPETTGYIVESLLKLYSLSGQLLLKTQALSCADWLCSIQRPDGAFPAGVGATSPPIVFDSGMILFGLTCAFEETHDPKYYESLLKATKWIENEMDADGCWRKSAYVEGWSPVYNSMVVWAMLRANQVIKSKTLSKKMSKSFQYYLKLAEEKLVPDSAFGPGEITYTHTLAYSLQGLLEASLLLKEKRGLEMVLTVATMFQIIFLEKNCLPGGFDPAKKYKRVYSFTCLTGDAQFSLLFYRLYELKKESDFLQIADSLLKGVLKYQNTWKNSHLAGGLAGSVPLWGNYQRFRYPNWAVKFLLDACVERLKSQTETD